MIHGKKPNALIHSRKQIEISGVPVDIIRKQVKNLNLRIDKSTGRVRVSCPRYVRDITISRFVLSKMDWINKHLAEFKKRKSVPEIRFISGEIHSVWGRKYELRIVERNGVPDVMIDEYDHLLLCIRPGSSSEKRQKVLKEWHRTELKRKIPDHIARLEPVMGVNVKEFGVKQMKTRWGTCNIRDRRIWLNLELAKLAPECLEYIVAHEMVHLLERYHNKQFYKLMDQFLPGWRATDKIIKNYYLAG